jgi:hypothetical protein
MTSTSTPTRITVRVIAKGGKFLGADIGGALVTIRNAQTGELLAKGNTSGGSGITTLMDVSITRQEQLPTKDASAFNATLHLTEPVLLKVTATGPAAGLQSINEASATQWMIPGKDITGGDGLLLELPGLLVQVQSPATHFNAGAAGVNSISFEANVTMMCGCPITAAAPWKNTDFEVGAIISILNADGTTDTLATVPLQFTGTTSQFTGQWNIPGPGFYEAVVYAYQPGNGNSGMGKVSFFIQPAT